MENLYAADGYMADDYAVSGILVYWGQKEIFVPRLALTLLQTTPVEVRQLNLDEFRLALKELESSEEGMPFPITHNHNTAVAVGGVVLARVIEIINDYTVTFSDGQYAVNLVGANSNVGDRVNVNQVSVRSANSAGLQDLSTLLSAAYNNQVCVDVQEGQPGTSAPLGTRARPSNNFADAKKIAEANSIRNIQLMRSATLANVDFSAGYNFVGDSEVVVSLELGASAQVELCSFQTLTVSGVMDGNNTFNNCNIMDISYTNGFIYQCALNGVITLGGQAKCSILDCWSNVADEALAAYPVMDMGGSGNSLALRNYSGGIALRNYSGGGAVSMDMASGRVILESSIVAEDVVIRGIAEVIDQTTGTAVVVDGTVNQTLEQLISRDIPSEVWNYSQ